MSSSDTIDVSTASAAAHTRYDEYEHTGVEWLGEIPAHWDVERLKWTITDCKNGYWGDSPEGDESDMNTVRVADFDRFALRVPDQDFTVRSVPPEKRDGRVLEPGDLLLEKSGGGDKQPVGVVMLYDLDEPAVCSNFIARMPVADGHNPSFLRYLHGALYEAGLNERAIKQSIGIQNLDADYYLNQKVGLPPLVEQRAIAAFLDRETERIDTLIEKKERLIDLLEEKRTALISRVVTKGLDADVEMQDSGVEWLGEIPVHWDTVKLKWNTDKIGSGVTPDGGSEAYVDDGVTFLRSQNVHFDGLRLDDVAYIDEETDEEMESTRVRPWDVLLNITGASIGRCTLVPSDFPRANVNQHVCIIRAEQEKLHPPYLSQVMASSVGQEQIFAEIDGASRDAVTFAEIGNFVTPKPPLEEQKRIAKHIEAQTSRIYSLISKIKEATERLKEYRTALISAAVTGQIDVREEVSEEVQL